MPSLISILGITLGGKTSIRFLAGVVLGLSFSNAVILSTIGIMDGFEDVLRSGLKRASGDLVLYSRRGFFVYEKKLENLFQAKHIDAVNPMVQTEGFLIKNEHSKGVVIRGIWPENLERVSGFRLDLEAGEIAVGKVLLEKLDAKVGDTLVLAFAKGNNEIASLPLLKKVKIKQVVDHKLYKKDERYLYMQKSELLKDLNLKNRVNLISLNVPKDEVELAREGENEVKTIERYQKELRAELGSEFILRPYWKEFGPLLEAVKVEKLTISLILQVIVIVSVFNVVAFIVFLNEKRAQEFFLIQALGASQRQLIACWSVLLLFIWFCSCVGGVLLTHLFDCILQKIPVPGDIYTLSLFNLGLERQDYLLVFALALLWICLLSVFSIFRLSRSSILGRLRKEFS